MTADGQRALSASDDRTVRVWDLRTGMPERTLKGTRAIPALAVTAAASSRLPATTGRCGSGTCGPVRRSRTPGGAHGRGPCVGGDGRRPARLSAGDDRTVRVWELRTGTLERTLEGHTYYVYRVAVTATATRALRPVPMERYGSGTCGPARWSGRWRRARRGQCVGGDGRRPRALSAGDDRTVRVWGLQTGQLLTVFYGDAPVLHCAVTVDGTTVVAGDTLGRVHILRWEEDTS